MTHYTRTCTSITQVEEIKKIVDFELGYASGVSVTAKEYKVRSQFIVACSLQLHVYHLGRHQPLEEMVFYYTFIIEHIHNPFPCLCVIIL